MPDLGKYASEVLSAYGVSLFLIGALVVVSLRRARKIKAQLDQIEGRRDG